MKRNQRRIVSKRRRTLRLKHHHHHNLLHRLQQHLSPHLTLIPRFFMRSINSCSSNNLLRPLIPTQFHLTWHISSTMLVITLGYQGLLRTLPPLLYPRGRGRPEQHQEFPPFTTILPLFMIRPVHILSLQKALIIIINPLLRHLMIFILNSSNQKTSGIISHPTTQ